MRTIQRTTLEYWALIAEIAGAIAIVVSVIYLGVQIRANTKVLRSQAHYNALSLAQRPFEMAIADQALADLIETSYASPEKLSEGQWFRCGNYLFMQFNSWEYLYYQNIDGSIPKQLWVGADAYFKSLVETKPGTQTFLVRVPACLRRPVSFLCGQRIREKDFAADASRRNTGLE